MELDQKKVKVPGRESVRDVLLRLKAQEDKPRAKLERFMPEVVKEETPKATQTENLPERNILSILNQIEALEKKMNKEGSYLNNYNDLRRLQDKFLKEVSFIGRNDIEISRAILGRMAKKKQEIEGRKR